MDTNKMREQFKQALHAQKEFKLSVEAIAAAEWAWQASREAVVIVLPRDVNLRARTEVRDMIRHHIEAQGLRVLP